MKSTTLATALAALLLAPAAVRAETVQTCTGFINSLPTVITSQGTWCMDSDLATNIVGGAAITVSTNNVTIDCNGFKLGNLAAGPGTGATGIQANARLNIGVRGCNVRGFFFGIDVNGGGGHQIEGNRLDGNLYTGILAAGDGNMVRGNTILDTGGSTATYIAFGLYLDGLTHAIDNTIHGLSPGTSLPDGYTYAIYTSGATGSVLERNRISGPTGTGTGLGFGILAQPSGGILIDRNAISLPPGQVGTGIFCSGPLVRVRDNFVFGFSSALDGCGNDGGNITLP